MYENPFHHVVSLVTCLLADRSPTPILRAPTQPATSGPISLHQLSSLVHHPLLIFHRFPLHPIAKTWPPLDSGPSPQPQSSPRRHCRNAANWWQDASSLSLPDHLPLLVHVSIGQPNKLARLRARKSIPTGPSNELQDREETAPSAFPSPSLQRMMRRLQ